MDPTTIMIVTAIIIIISGIIMTTMTSIGIECYNAKGHEAFKTKKSSNFKFLIFSLVVGILMIIGGFGLGGTGIYLKFKTGGLI